MFTRYTISAHKHHNFDVDCDIDFKNRLPADSGNSLSVDSKDRLPVDSISSVIINTPKRGQTGLVVFDDKTHLVKIYNVKERSTNPCICSKNIDHSTYNYVDRTVTKNGNIFCVLSLLFTVGVFVVLGRNRRIR